jgi:hypothetical protein
MQTKLRYPLPTGRTRSRQCRRLVGCIIPDGLGVTDGNPRGVVGLNLLQHWWDWQLGGHEEHLPHKGTLQAKEDPGWRILSPLP